ncbi:hypothetical protein ACFSTD_10615 [Novosphingobium colocasiae]
MPATAACRSRAGAIAICPLLDLAGEGDSADIPSDPLIGRDLIVGMGSVYIGERDPHEHPPRLAVVGRTPRPRPALSPRQQLRGAA